MFLWAGREILGSYIGIYGHSSFVHLFTDIYDTPDTKVCGGFEMRERVRVRGYIQDSRVLQRLSGVR